MSVSLTIVLIGKMFINPLEGRHYPVISLE